MQKPPRSLTPRLRKTGAAVERVADRATVARQADSRQAGLFDKPIPACIKTCLPTLVEKPPVGPAWVHEIKWDGYRVSAYVENGAVTIRTRNGRFGGEGLVGRLMWVLAAASIAGAGTGMIVAAGSLQKAPATV